MGFPLVVFQHPIQKNNREEKEQPKEFNRSYVQPNSYIDEGQTINYVLNNKEKLFSFFAKKEHLLSPAILLVIFRYHLNIARYLLPKKFQPLNHLGD